MSESILLQLPVSEEYDALFAQAREQTGLRKCRCWFDRSSAIGDIRIEVTDHALEIRYHTQKGITEDRCLYSAVVSLTELKTGIVVRLSHGRMLFLPSGGGRDYMKNLIQSVLLMEKHISYRFRDGAMSLRGVGFSDRLTFRLRPDRGIHFSVTRIDQTTKWSTIALLCLTLFIATVFVTQPLRNQRITPEQAESVTAVYQGEHGYYRRSSLRSVTLHFQNHPDLTVEYRPAALLESIEQLEPGTTLELLVHPDDAGILQVAADGVVLLDFEGTMAAAWTDAVAFAGLGVFLYLCVGYVVYALFLKKKR